MYLIFPYSLGIDRIRGHCIGGIVAFDKHWNLALVDVDEQYERKRVRKSAPLIDTKLSSEFAQLKCKENKPIKINLLK